MSNNDDHFPTIDSEFLIQAIKKSKKLSHSERIGKVHVFIKEGASPINKRIKTLPTVESGQIPYEYAIGIAIFFGFLDDLMEWCKKERSWTDGGYSERLNKKQQRGKS